jgi:hypothetical protein
MDSLTQAALGAAVGEAILAEKDGKIRIYNMQCDMQGVRTYGNYKAPTAFYFEIAPKQNGDFELNTEMHQRESKNYL